MKTLSLLLMGIMCTSYYTQAQFVNSYGSPMFETARGVERTNANNYLLSGWNMPGPYGGGDATLMRTNGAGGYLAPTVIYGGLGLDRFYSARQVTIGGPFAYVATGHTNSFGFGGDDIYFAGTTAALGCVAQSTLGGAGTDRAYCIQEVNDAFYGNCFAIVGESNSYAFLGGKDVYMALISPGGGLLTASVIGTGNDDVGHWIEQTSDGGYIITGFTTTLCATPADPSNIYVVKMAPTPAAGNLVVAWNQIIEFNPGASQNEKGYCVKEDPSNPNNYIVVGETNSWGAGGYDAFIMNINAAGVGAVCTWGGINNDHARGLQIINPLMANGGYIVSGYGNSWNQPAPDMSAFLIKMNGLCNVVAARLLMPNNGVPDFGYELATSDVPGGGVTMVGETQSLTPGNSQNYLVETDLGLNTFTVCEFGLAGMLNNPPFCVTANTQSVSVDNQFQVPCNNRTMNWMTNACAPAPPPAAKIAGSENSAEFVTLSPNPTSDNVSIAYSETYSGSVIKIMDAQGRLVDSRSLGSNGTEMLDVSKYPAGIYFINITKPGGNTEILRFVKSE